MEIAVVTGASVGIGRAAATEISRRGTGVVVTYRDRAHEASEAVAKIEAAGGSAVSLPLDVADLKAHPEFVDRLVAVLREKWHLEQVSALVNNAGIGGGAAFSDVTEEQFDRFHDVLFKGPYFLTQRLLPLLRDGAAIVNVGSSSALSSGTEAGYSSYASQKGAIHVLTRCWAKELGERGIRVNAVAPGSTRTRIADDAFERMPEAVAAAAATVTLGRIGEPDDVGRVIAFLSGPDSGWVTGQVLECSGGQGL